MLPLEEIVNKFLVLSLLSVSFLAPKTASATRAGAGLNVGTMVVPGNYPLRFPSQVRDNNSTGISKIRGDAHVGLEGAFYMSDAHRIGAVGALGFGSGYFDRNFLLKYDYVFAMDEAEVLVGGGLGMGRSTFQGADDEKLDMPYYPLRFEAGPALNQGFIAEQLLLYVQYNIPSGNTYTNAAGAEEDAGAGLSMMLGAELVVMFGSF
ncbi:MAG: hypothetical protein ACI8S6_003369 [Myxococcota bacterium]|jgi:hypothetical protein